MAAAQTLPLKLARRALFWTHLCAGLAVSLYAVVIGVTGSILVFNQELEAIENPLLHSGSLPQNNITPARALAAVRAAYPDRRPISLTYPNEQTPLWMSYTLPRPEVQGPGAMEVYVDPGTGRIAGVRDPKSGWLGWLQRLHYNLSSGATGRKVNGIGALALLVLAATGLALWVPWSLRWERRYFVQRLSISLRAGWRRLVWQLHHSAGLASAAFVVVIAISGAYFIWSSDFIRVVARVLPRGVEPKVPQHPATAALADLDRLTAITHAAMPGVPIHRMQVVETQAQSVRVTLRLAEPEAFHRVNTLILDPVTGDVLKAVREGERAPGDAFLSWIAALHFGVFAGLPGKLLWALLGLSLPLMSVTGFLMWWKRVMEPRLRSKASIAEPAPQAVEA